MQLTLESNEAELLRATLERAIGELRMEIGKTENFEMRNALKHDESLMKGLLDRVRAGGVASRS